MDPITHSLIGGVAAKTMNVSRRRFWVMVFLGLAPDLDVLFNLFGGWAQPLQHRGLTHSIVGLIVQPFLFSWFLGRWDQGPFLTRTFHYSLPLAFHIGGDLLTSYGVPLFLPFHQESVSWDLIGSVNLIPTSLTIAGLWWIHKKQESGWKATGPLWAVWGLYLFLVFSGRSYATKIAPTAESVTLLPSLVNPFTWRVVGTDISDHKYRHYKVDLLTGECHIIGTSLMPNGDYPVQASLDSSQVKEFISHHRWPVVRTTSEGENWLVEWGSIVYSTRGMVRGKLALKISAEGRILKEERIFKFWTPELT